MGDYKVVIGILGFLIFSHLTLVEFQAGEHFFQDVNITEDELTFTPSDPSPQYLNVDLDNPDESANISFVDTDTLNNTDYDTPQTAVLEDGKDSGYLAYELPEAESVKTKAPRESILVDPRTEFSTGDSNRTADMRGEDTWIFEQSEDTAVVKFTEDSGFLGQREPRLYEITASSNAPDTGVSAIPVIGGLIDVIYGLVSTPLKFWAVFKQFPFYFQVFYGGLIAWLIADILQVG